jgi:hypothetical protein
MSDTFRIKPLVWEKEYRPSEAYTATPQPTFFRVAVWYSDALSLWGWCIDNRDSIWHANGLEKTPEDAKARAESAYRDLLMAALEPA